MASPAANGASPLVPSQEHAASGCGVTNLGDPPPPPPCCLSTGHLLGLLALALALGPPRSPRGCRDPPARRSHGRETQLLHSGFTSVCQEKVARYSYSPKLLIFSNYTLGRSLINVLCENIKNG